MVAVAELTGLGARDDGVGGVNLGSELAVEFGNRVGGVAGAETFCGAWHLMRKRETL